MSCQPPGGGGAASEMLRSPSKSTTNTGQDASSHNNEKRNYSEDYLYMYVTCRIEDILKDAEKFIGMDFVSSLKQACL